MDDLENMASDSKEACSWSDDKLGRKAYADFLSSYLIQKSQDSVSGFVLNLDAEWGNGKTFFIKRWMNDLRSKGHPVSYYDAWENDFSDNPLLGVIDRMDSDLKARLSKTEEVKTKLEDAFNGAKKLIKPMGVAFASIALKQLAGLSLEALRETASSTEVEPKIDALINAGADALLEEHRLTRGYIDDFKKKLLSLLESLRKSDDLSLPVFVFVDELDRCRPTYSIELLEAIKHIFGVSGVCFVVATSSKQLGASIQAIYGEGFDSERYLKRFFDATYSLPSGEGLAFSDFSFRNAGLLGLRNYFTHISGDDCSDDQKSIFAFHHVCELFGLALRDRQQVAASLYAAISAFDGNGRVLFTYLAFLVALKHVSEDAFNAIVNDEITGIDAWEKCIGVCLKKDVVFKQYSFNQSFRTYDEVDANLSQFLFEITMLSKLSMPEVANRCNSNTLLGRSSRVLLDMRVLGSQPRFPLRIYEDRVKYAGYLE